MAGEVKVLEFSEGESTLSPPNNVLISSNSTLTFANDGAYVAAKGSAATLGDFYGNSTTGKLRQHNGITFLDLNNTLDNLTAVVAPTVNEDSGDFYQVGSKWLNTATGEWYFANDVTAGAAVWKGIVDKETNQTITGQKTFSGITTFSNTTDATDKDTAGAIFEGGVGIEKSVFIGLNLTVLGDFTVQGTQTILNTSVLDVEDANISINKNGNQASADNIAGIRVEMSNATHVLIKYDSTLASRWKIGDLASEAEVITASHTQTLTNKKLQDSTTTIIDETDPTKIAKFQCSTIQAGVTRTFTFPDADDTFAVLSATQTLLNKALDDSTTTFRNTASPTKLARIDCTSVTAGQTRVVTVPDMDLTLLGTSTAQTISNKIIDGGTASASRYWLLPGDTLANLTALARVEKALYYDETNNTIVYDDGATLNPVGSGSGGAGGGISLVWRNDNTLAAVESTRFNQLAYDFTAGDTQKVYASIKVPTGYIAGKQIVLKIKIASPTGANNVLFTAVSTLIRNGVDALSSTTNQRTSTNTAQAIGSADFEYEVTLDITSALAQINAVGVSALDTILVELTRGTDTNTDIAYFMPSLAEVYVTP